MDRILYQFHVHTESSLDCNLSYFKLYKKLKSLGIHGVAITDHNTIKGALEFNKKYGHDIHVIIGEEIMTTKGEIIGLFLSEEIPKGLTPKETIEAIKSQDGIVYIPHPFDKNRHKTCLDKKYIINNIDNIDIIESFNGRVIDSYDNDRANKFSKCVSKPIICGSDSHSAYELGYNMMCFKCGNLNKNNLIAELDKAEFTNIKLNRKIHLYTKYVRLNRLIKAGNFSELYEIIHRKCKKRLSNFI